MGSSNCVPQTSLYGLRMQAFPVATPHHPPCICPTPIGGLWHVCAFPSSPRRCQVRVLLSRPAHATPGYKVAGKVVRAFAPHCPVPREESWYLLLTDPANNLLLSFQKVGGLLGEWGLTATGLHMCGGGPAGIRGVVVVAHQVW
jgi:hypothetical protein